MRLSDACEINPRSQAVSDDTLVSFVAMPDVSEDGKINTSIVRPYGEVKKGYTVFQEGDILFAKITPCMENGKGALAVGLQNGIGVGSTEFHVLRPNTDLLDGMWLYYLTAWPAFRHEAEIHMTGSAGQKRVPKTFLERYQLAIPTLDEQKDQVSQLDRIRRIIDSRQRQLRTLDTLIKARFVEMFGNPETNPKGWEQVTLGDVCSSIVRGPFGSALKKEFFVAPDATTYKVYEQKHAIQKSATIGTYYITAEKFNELRRFECVAGDILVSCSGTMGELYQLPEGCERGIINQALCKFTLNEKILPVCFLVYMRQTIGNLETKGSSIQNIAAVSYVKAMPINLPPMEIQEQFAAFVSQVDKSKNVVLRALEQAQVLFDSLMQQYFG